MGACTARYSGAQPATAPRAPIIPRQVVARPTMTFEPNPSHDGHLDLSGWLTIATVSEILHTDSGCRAGPGQVYTAAEVSIRT